MKMAHELCLIEIILWIVVIILFGVFAIKLYDKYRKEKSKYILGIAIFFLVFLVHRIINFLQVFVFKIPYKPYYDYPLELGELGELGLQIGFFASAYGGLLVLYFVLESYVIKTRYIFTALTAILIFIVFLKLIIHVETLPLQIPFFLVVVLGIPSIYFYIAIKSPGDVRRNSIILAIGMVIFIFGLAFAIPSLQESIWSMIFPISWIYEILAPVLHIIGLILMYRGFLRSST
jgi:hypothetical protein